MAISDTIQSMYNNVDSAYTSLANKGATIPANKNLANLAACADSIPAGGEEKTVFLYDPYGTLIASYTKTEFLALSSYPTPPTLSRLTFQEYNWPLADAKAHVTKYDYCNIGATYVTTSGALEVDIELTKVTGLTVTLAVTGVKDWGDGTSDTATSHTYADYGSYMIVCNMTASETQYIFGQSYSSPNYYVKEIRVGTVHVYAYYGFAYLRSVKYIILSTYQTISQYLCNYDYSLEAFVMPSSFGTSSYNSRNMFCYCASLRTCCIAYNYNPQNTDNNIFLGCMSLKSIVFSEQTRSSGDIYSYDRQPKLDFYINPNMSSASIMPYNTQGLVKLLYTKVKSNGKLFDYLSSSNLKQVASIKYDDSTYNLTTIPDYFLAGNQLVTEFEMADTITTIGRNAFANSLVKITHLPSSLVTIGLYAFSDCLELSGDLVLPIGVTAIPEKCFGRSVSSNEQSTSAVTSLVCQGDIASIGANAFAGFSACLLFDFSNTTGVPTLDNINAFNDINSICKIVVPDALYESWIAASNWTTYANYIYKASEVN